jgi:fumarate hydratase subunit alpha
MRKIASKKIQQEIKRLFIKANLEIRPDILKGLEKAWKKETQRASKEMLSLIIKNANIAKEKKLALCQDTGLPIVYIELGEEVYVKGSLKKAAVNAAREAYMESCLRQSIVSDPILRKPPFKYSPALVHIETKAGSKIKISVMAKGFGSENKSKLRMMNPTATRLEIESYIIDCLKEAGPDACPPYIVGVGIGATAEGACWLAKKALFLSLDSKSYPKHIAAMEKRLFKKINGLNIGVMGLGGKATCLGVKILTSPTHIAGLPVAVNIGCHATRTASKII